MGLIYKDNDMQFKLANLRRADTLAYIDDATLTFNLYDSAAVLVTGGGPLTMTSDGAGTGSYRATMPGTVTLTANAQYTGKVTCSNYTLYFEQVFTAVVRTG